MGKRLVVEIISEEETDDARISPSGGDDEPGAADPTPGKLKDMQASTFYLPREGYEKLRFLAFSRRCSLNSLICEALDEYFEKLGHPERFSTRTRKA